jgi:serine/threonine-protein kinase
VDDALIGSELAGCRIDAVAGRGGMGVVYRATELRLGRPVALKLIAADRAADPAFRARFEREARMTASIDHPNVIPVYAAGEDGGHLYLVMRWVSGTDLHALVRAEGRLAPRRAALIVEQVAAALDAAHEAGLVHRDVKPANVLLDAGDHVYLSDFGLTRTVDSETVVTDTNEWLGTVDYMSPEQLDGQPVDARSDVYALGCVLYTALTGAPPFHRATVAATISAQLHDPVPRATPAFEGVLGRALAKDPAGRFASAGELGRAALDAAARESPVEAATVRVPPRSEPVEAATVRVSPRRHHRRRPRLAPLALIAAVLGAVIAAVVLTASSGGERTGPLRADEVAGVARSFARAYAHENAGAMERLMAGGVQRVSPSDVERGRRSVLAEYRRQFANDRIRGYRLGDLVAQGGRAGRASGRYVVTRAGRADITGKVAFGMERVRGRPVIRLIATEPRS